MTIVILKTAVTPNYETGEPEGRSAYIYITNGTTPYMYDVGGLALTGSLQTILNGMEAGLYTEAAANGKVPTSTEIAIVEAIAWYVANSGAKADVFDKSITQLATDITAMVNSSFPSASAAIKTGWVRTLMSSLLDTRVNAHDRDLV